MKEWCNFYNLHNINYSNLNSKSLEEKRKKGLIFQYEKDAHLLRVFINITYKSDEWIFAEITEILQSY